MIGYRYFGWFVLIGGYCFDVVLVWTDFLWVGLFVFVCADWWGSDLVVWFGLLVGSLVLKFCFVLV